MKNFVWFFVVICLCAAMPSSGMKIDEKDLKEVSIVLRSELAFRTYLINADEIMKFYPKYASDFPLFGRERLIPLDVMNGNQVVVLPEIYMPYSILLKESFTINTFFEKSSEDELRPISTQKKFTYKITSERDSLLRDIAHKIAFEEELKNFEQEKEINSLKNEVKKTEDILQETQQLFANEKKQRVLEKEQRAELTKCRVDLHQVKLALSSIKFERDVLRLLAPVIILCFWLYFVIYKSA